MIRPYQARDRDDVYDICVRTGAAGRDARGLFSTDELIPDIYAGPYVELEPEHAYVLDNGERAVGYVIGTASTPAFVAACKREWLPRMRLRYDLPGEAPVTREQQKLLDMFSPERLLHPELAPHPAHLHIDLLPEYQRGGHGRAMIGIFLASVAAAGARSCHLMVRPGNAGALVFYAKTGWRELAIESPGDWIVLTRPTT
ncbi:MAG TPA: GNAT family N-acetyltransferase [Streptosporangiaceae bacterium]|nr:GNAT family N-acetyltransferase [Streptosporangiaceae bacterium]